MRTLVELLSADDAWPTIVDWVAAAGGAEVLPPAPKAADDTLLALQVTTRSALGSIAQHSGGIVVDSGWLRLLGSGHPRLGGGLREWNASLGGRPLDPPLDGAVVVAYDALGGFFAVNGGAWPADLGLVHYLAPDTQAWESLGLGHGAFVQWSLSDRPAKFYADDRWEGWRDEVELLGPDEILSVYPPLGFESTPIGSRARRPVPARAQWSLVHEIARQTAGLPDGAAVRFAVE